jgi:xylulokinase
VFGFPAPIELSDASGMNIMNILTRNWDDRLLTLIGGDADDLRKKLGGSEPMPGGTALGTVGNWWMKRWGFSDSKILRHSGI